LSQERRKNRGRSAGAPAWLVTFADLMSLLVAFFVLIISFSVPDTEKLKIAAGSIRDAFGITREVIVTGVVELDGNPVHKFAQELSPEPINDVVGPIPDQGREINYLSASQQAWEQDGTEPGALADAAAFEAIEEELHQAMQQSPELAQLAEHLVVERTPEDLRIQIIDQARRSMFPLGSAQMYPPIRSLLREVAGAIAGLPNKVTVAGHTDGHPYRQGVDYDNWSLSLDRADATRRVLVEAGLAAARFASVTGKADTDHMFPDDPLDPRNRRISITLLRQPPEARAQAEEGAARAGGASGAIRPATRDAGAAARRALALDLVEAGSIAPRAVDDVRRRTPGADDAQRLDRQGGAGVGMAEAGDVRRDQDPRVAPEGMPGR